MADCRFSGMSVRSCGCTYRDTGSRLAHSTFWVASTTESVIKLLSDEPMAWGQLCTKLVCRDYWSRDELHRILHSIAEPVITPTEGRGRRGTLWKLKGTGESGHPASSPGAQLG
jgi:hypothetical protein